MANRVAYVIFSHLTISKRYLDALVIQKFAKHDESKIKELQLSIEKLTEERNKARKALETETTDTLSAQIELEKIADEFRTAHNSRKVRNFSSVVFRDFKRSIKNSILPCCKSPYLKNPNSRDKKLT